MAVFDTCPSCSGQQGNHWPGCDAQDEARPDYLTTCPDELELVWFPGHLDPKDLRTRVVDLLEEWGVPDFRPGDEVLIGRLVDRAGHCWLRPDTSESGREHDGWLPARPEDSGARPWTAVDFVNAVAEAEMAFEKATDEPTAVANHKGT